MLCAAGRRKRITGPGGGGGEEKGNQRWGFKRPLRLFSQSSLSLSSQILPLLSCESMSVCVCVCVYVSLSLWISFFLSFSDSFSVLCACAHVHGAGSVSPLFLPNCCLWSLPVSPVCSCRPLVMSPPLFASVLSFFILSLYLCLDLFLFLSLSRPVSHPVRPKPPSPASTRGLRVSSPSLLCLLTLGSCSQLPNPGLSCPPLLGLGEGGRGRKGGQPGGPTPFCLSRLGGWASGPFNQPG